jgi:hypothetical protein
LCSGVVLDHNKGFEKRLPPQATRFDVTGRLDRRFVHDLEIEDIPGNLVRFGTPGADPEVLVWGDSLAMAILPAIKSLCEEARVGACAATHSSTAPVIGYWAPGRYGLRERSIKFNDAVMNYIRIGKVRSVVLVGMWSGYFEDAEFPDALLKTIDTLQSIGVTVYFMNAVPSFDFNAAKALVLYSWRGWDLSRLSSTISKYDDINRSQNRFLPELRDRGVIILDPIPTILARSKSDDILPFDCGGSFYRDDIHLSTYGALAMKPLFFNGPRKS